MLHAWVLPASLLYGKRERERLPRPRQRRFHLEQISRCWKYFKLRLRFLRHTNRVSCRHKCVCILQYTRCFLQPISSFPAHPASSYTKDIQSKSGQSTFAHTFRDDGGVVLFFLEQGRGVSSFRNILFHFISAKRSKFESHPTREMR